MGGGFMREKQAGAERWWVGPWSCPPGTLGALDAGRPGCTVPGIAWERAAHALGGPDGSHPVPLSSAAASGLHHPKKTAGGSSVPCNHTVSRTKA
jgi:hypothetical protein